MNDKIVETVKAKMKDDGITQEALANRLGMARTNLVRLVNGHIGSVPKRWQDVLNELGLELVAVPKNADVSESEQKTPVDTVSKATEKRLDVSRNDTNKSVKPKPPLKLSSEVAELRRRWERGEYKKKDVHTPDGVWICDIAHSELALLFQKVQQKRSRVSLARLVEIAPLNVSLGQQEEGSH